jgi:hypothetical protein
VLCLGAFSSRKRGMIGRSPDIGGISRMAAAGKMKVFGYRILAAGTQGLAAQQTPAGQQAASPRAEAGDRNPCIIGARGVEAAAWAEQGA